MIESGDYVDIRYQDEVRYKKPVGIYWLQAGVVKTAENAGYPQARTTIWLYRIPSLIGAIGAVLLTYWAALAFVSRRMAYLAGLMMATSVLLTVEARLAKTDAALLACCVAAMAVMARAYLTQSTGRDIGWGHALILWTALAAGILLKGPLILMVVGLAAASVSIADRSARWLMRLRPLVGVLWVLILVLPWFVAIMARAGDSFFQESVGQDLLAKVFQGQETHGAPPGYYLLLFWLTFWPAAPLAAMAAPAVWRQRREPPVRFLLAWLVPSWIVFELVVTKLPHYVLPLYPAIAILIALDDRAPRAVGQPASGPLQRDVAALRRDPAGRRRHRADLSARPVRLARLAVRGGSRRSSASTPGASTTWRARSGRSCAPASRRCACISACSASWCR